MMRVADRSRRGRAWLPAPEEQLAARPRVVIIGGGFGGLACARRLYGQPVEVVLLDRRNYHQFTPLLYQVATALLTAPDIAYPLRAVFPRRSNVRFTHGLVNAVDLERRVVHVRGAVELPFDYLVLATGSENNFFGNETLAAQTLSLKTLPQAQRLRNHVLACVEHATQTPDPAEQRRLLTFVTVGGGPTGVEFTGALLELLRLVVGREYPELSPQLPRVVLIEGTSRLLPALTPSLGRYAQRVLEQRGVEVLTDTLVERVSAECVTLAGGREIPAATAVWSAGIRATQLAGLERQPQTAQRRIDTDEHLRLLGQSRVFAVGDLAAIRVAGREVPMLSPYAIQEGRHVARVIVNDVLGKPPGRPFHPRDKGTMAVIGRNAAVGSIKRLQLTGRIGWSAWLGVHIYYLIGFRNRAVVLLNWAWNYLRKDRPIRMITNIDRDPLADQLVVTSLSGAPPQASRLDRAADS